MIDIGGIPHDVSGALDYEPATRDEEARVVALVFCCHHAACCDGGDLREVELYGDDAERAFDEHEGLVPGSSRMAAE